MHELERIAECPLMRREPDVSQAAAELRLAKFETIDRGFWEVDEVSGALIGNRTAGPQPHAHANAEGTVTLYKSAASP